MSVVSPAGDVKPWRPRRRKKTPPDWELAEICAYLRSDAAIDRSKTGTRVRTLRDEAADAIEALQRDLKAARA